MKEYLHNKDFLPKSFIISKNKKINSINKRDSILLTIIAFAILPISFINIKSNNKKVESVVSNTSDISTTKNLQNEKLYRWINITDRCMEGNFTKYEGKIYLCGKQNFEDILKNENIVINTMEDLGENKYRLQVVQKENY